MNRRDLLKSILPAAASVSIVKATLAESPEPIVLRGDTNAKILVGRETSPVLQSAASALRSEISRRTGIALPIGTSVEVGSADTAILINTGSGDANVTRVLHSLGQRPATTEWPGREGFVLASGRLGNQRVAIVNGSDDLGSFHGVGWLLRKMDFDENEAAIPAELSLSTAPRMPMRRIRFGVGMGYQETEPEQLRDIWTEYILWGLSATTCWWDPAQHGDPRHSEYARDFRDKWARSVPVAKLLGLQLAVLIQTSLVAFDGEFGPANIPDFERLHATCPDFNGVNPKFPEAMNILLASRKWFFDNMPEIDQVDYFLTSGWDSGGCMDPDLTPWAVKYAELVDKIYPFIKAHKPNAKIILGLYGVHGCEALAARLSGGWKPEWLYGLEFDGPRLYTARLFPQEYKRFCINIGWPLIDFSSFDCVVIEDSGATPCPQLCREQIARMWDNGVRDGLGTYSEGVHDYLEQMVMLQLGWDPDRPVTEIVEEICRYYFGRKAAPMISEAVFLMEKEQPANLNTPMVDPKVQQLVAEAEKQLPAWARSSWQWALIAGRAGIDRTRLRQAFLMAEFDDHLDAFRASFESNDSPSSEKLAKLGDYCQELTHYLRAVLANAWDMIDVISEMDQKGFSVQGGSQWLVWPDPRTGEALECLAILQHLQSGGAKAARPGRWSLAFIDSDGNVKIADGWGNYLSLDQSPMDARMVVAERGDGEPQLLFLGKQNRLCGWSAAKGCQVLTEEPLITGPLAAGDLDGDGKEEILVLSGESLRDAQLTVIDSAGRLRKLNVRLGGIAAEQAPEDLSLKKPHLAQSVALELEPFVAIADADSDGTNEIVCTDADSGHIVVLDATGRIKATGPRTQGAVLFAGSLDDDRTPDFLFTDAKGTVHAFSVRKGVRSPRETIVPHWPSAVVIARLKGANLPQIVYIDQARYLRATTLEGRSRRLSELSTSPASGPGMVVGDFDGDGKDEICYLRQNLTWEFPRATLSLAGGSGNLRFLWQQYKATAKPWTIKNEFLAPLGARAAGKLRLLGTTAWDHHAS